MVQGALGVQGTREEVQADQEALGDLEGIQGGACPRVEVLFGPQDEALEAEEEELIALGGIVMLAEAVEEGEVMAGKTRERWLAG